jgi:WhiB family transcriptional regulator, redox-sensing transcriptional regulator
MIILGLIILVAALTAGVAGVTTTAARSRSQPFLRPQSHRHAASILVLDHPLTGAVRHSAGSPAAKNHLRGSRPVPRAVTCPDTRHHTGRASGAELAPAAVVVAAPVPAPGALPERLAMLSSQIAVDFPGWTPRAACRGEDPELFFPIATAGPALTQVFAAKAVCFRCAVRAGCLSYALATGPAGIWGGTTQEERHAMRRSPGLDTCQQTASPGLPSPAAHHHRNSGGQ